MGLHFQTKHTARCSRRSSRNNAWYYRRMRKQAWVFLLAGFIIGFGVLYMWTKQRAPGIVRAMPLPVDGTSVSAAQPQEPAPPPVDMARVQQLQTEIKNNPKNFEALVELANIHFDQKTFEDAINIYSKALEARPDDVNVRTDLGTAMFYDNRVDDGIAEFRKALELNPNHGPTLFNMGVAMLHGKKDPQSALQYWEKLVQANPNYPQVDLIKEQIRLLKEQQRKP